MIPRPGTIGKPRLCVGDSWVASFRSAAPMVAQKDRGSGKLDQELTSSQGRCFLHPHQLLLLGCRRRLRKLLLRLRGRAPGHHPNCPHLHRWYPHHRSLDRWKQKGSFGPNIHHRPGVAALEKQFARCREDSGTLGVQLFHGSAAVTNEFNSALKSVYQHSET